MLEGVKYHTVYIHLLATITIILASRGILFSRQSKESLLEGNIQCSNCSFLLAVPLQVLDRPPLSKAVACCAVTVIVTVNALQPLHLLHDLHRILLYQGLVRQHVLLLGAAVQVCTRQDVRNGSKPTMNQVSSGIHQFSCIYSHLYVFYQEH